MRKRQGILGGRNNGKRDNLQGQLVKKRERHEATDLSPFFGKTTDSVEINVRGGFIA